MYAYLLRATEEIWRDGPSACFHLSKIWYQPGKRTPGPLNPSVQENVQSLFST
jgi:hypothetical protein